MKNREFHFLTEKKLEDTDSAFPPVNRKFYYEISDRILKVLRSYANIFEQVGIDEAYSDVT